MKLIIFIHTKIQKISQSTRTSHKYPQKQAVNDNFRYKRCKLIAFHQETFKYIFIEEKQ